MHGLSRTSSHRMTRMKNANSIRNGVRSANHRKSTFGAVQGMHSRNARSGPRGARFTGGRESIFNMIKNAGPVAGIGMIAGIGAVGGGIAGGIGGSTIGYGGPFATAGFFGGGILAGGIAAGGYGIYKGGEKAMSTLAGIAKPGTITKGGNYMKFGWNWAGGGGKTIMAAAGLATGLFATNFLANRVAGSKDNTFGNAIGMGVGVAGLGAGLHFGADYLAGALKGKSSRANYQGVRYALKGVAKATAPYFGSFGAVGKVAGIAAAGIFGVGLARKATGI